MFEGRRSGRAPRKPILSKPGQSIWAGLSRQSTMPSPRSLSSSDGFTLPELLVVMLIIGVLAAIALPSFIGQTSRGKDATAKSDGALLARVIEHCWVESGDYRDCNTLDKLTTTGSNPNVSMGAGAGQVEIAATTANTYRVDSHARSGTTYTISRLASGVQERTCDQSNRGGCPASGRW
jgi:type IV pilus assembly protein PilA